MQSDDIQRYLDTVCAGIRRKQIHAAIRAELSAHLEDHIEQLMLMSGLSPEEAEQTALRCMGDPVMLGQVFDRIHGRWKPIILHLLTVGFWVAIVVILLDVLYLMSRWLVM